MNLGDWVIRKTLADVAEWPGDFRIAINLSPTQIRNPHLIATVDGALAAAGIAPGRLEFEITESVLLEDAVAGAARSNASARSGGDCARRFRNRLFVAELSARFRFDRVKIDRAFVRDIETSDEARRLSRDHTPCRGAWHAHHREGVERPEQLDLLRKLGCDEAQGFLMSPSPSKAQRIEQSRIRGDDLPEVAEELEDYREARRAALAEGRSRSGN